MIPIGDLQDDLDACGGDVEATARFLFELRNAQRQVGDLVRDAEDRLADMMPTKIMELPGLPAFERRRGSTRRKWQSEDLAVLVMRRTLDPAGTGEVDVASYEAARRVVDALVKVAPFTGSMGWRSKALKEMGVDPDEWCESSPGRVSVQFHKAVDQ